jgi:S-adenosylmethionine decarboxylase
MGIGKHAYIKLISVPMQWVSSINSDVVIDLFNKALKKNGATPVKSICETFKPDGYTACIILKESHCVIHTWPEKRVMTIDLFYCGKKFSFSKFARSIGDSFYPATGQMALTPRK